MERLGEDVQRVLGRLGPGSTIAPLVTAWPGAVGDDVARNAWPARMSRDGTLLVNTSSSAWAFELTHLAEVVLEQLRAAVGEDAPAALRFVPGPLPEPPAPAAPDAPRRPREPSAEAVSEASDLVAQIADEELRERVARAAALSLQHARDDRRF
jgi:hypothetical protein